MLRPARIAAIPVLAAGLALTAGPAAGGTASPAVLGDYGSSIVPQTPRPGAIHAPFKDLTVTRLRWSRWGTGRATATGAARLNTCQPTCADGRIAIVPGARVTVTRQARGTCRGRTLRFYTRIAIRFPRLPVGQVSPRVVTARPRCAG